LVAVEDQHVLRAERYLADPVVGRLVSNEIDERLIIESRLHTATTGCMHGEIELLLRCRVAAGVPAPTMITTHPFMMPASRSRTTKQR